MKLQDTCRIVQQCFESLDDFDVTTSSKEEQVEYLRFLRLCEEITLTSDDLYHKLVYALRS